MSQKVNLIYKLEGSAVANGINVYDLSPLLMSIGDLVQEGQSIVHPGGKSLGVNIRPFQEGSFIIELLVFAENNLQSVLELTRNQNVQEIKELLEWLGIITAPVGGVIWLYKWLKGQPKKFEEVEGDQIRITAKDNRSITVNRNVFSLFQNNKVQQSIYHIYGNFLGKDGIDRVKSFVEGDEEHGVEVIGDDVPFFNPANTIPLDSVNNETRNITRVFLKPKRVSVEGEPDNWSLRKGSDVIITATIKDQDFLKKVKIGEVRLSSEDLLEVDLVEIQTLLNDEPHVKYEVIKIVSYRKSPSLFLEI